MKVKKIYVKNLRQIDEKEVSFNGQTAIITGGNNKGKTTLLRSIVDRLRGQKTNIIKQGKSSGECQRTFTDGSVLSWDLDGEKERISYITKEEFKETAIKSICHILFGKGFDIDAFLSSTPKDQKKILQELVGLDFTVLDKEYEQAYADRAEANVILKTVQMKRGSLEPVIVKGKYKDIGEMQEALISMETSNERINGVTVNIQDRMVRSSFLTEQIKSLQSEQMVIAKEIAEWVERINNNQQQDTSKQREEINAQKEFNAGCEVNRQVAIVLEDINTAKQSREEKDAIVKSIEGKKEELIKTANMPAGFEFTEDGILFNGFELSKSTLSSSQTYIAGLMLASMNMGEVEALFFDASYLDRNSLNEVVERANKKDLQLIVERPDFDGGEIRYDILSL